MLASSSRLRTLLLLLLESEVTQVLAKVARKQQGCGSEDKTPVCLASDADKVKAPSSHL